MDTFVFSMGELWGRNTDRRLFDAHVNAVTLFLSDQIRLATSPPAARANASPVTAEQITPESGGIDYLLTFDLPAGCRILQWPDRPLPEVVCSLQFRENEGLFLLWSSRLETKFGTLPPREALLSRLVTGMAYDYYDDSFKRWTTEPTFRPGQNNTTAPAAPQRLRLTFTYGKMSRQTTVPLPTTPQGLPNF
jgi:hypothetical protein